MTQSILYAGLVLSVTAINYFLGITAARLTSRVLKFCDVNTDGFTLFNTLGATVLALTFSWACAATSKLSPAIIAILLSFGLIAPLIFLTVRGLIVIGTSYCGFLDRNLK